MSADLDEFRPPIIKTQSADKNGGEEGSQSPRTPEHKIPAALTCPAAPRKPTRRRVTCKRKLRELDFFEIVARAEIESFFRRAEEEINAPAGKKTRVL